MRAGGLGAVAAGVVGGLRFSASKIAG